MCVLGKTPFVFILYVLDSCEFFSGLIVLLKNLKGVCLTLLIWGYYCHCFIVKKHNVLNRGMYASHFFQFHTSAEIFQGIQELTVNKKVSGRQKFRF